MLPDASEYAVSASFAYDGVPGVEGVGRASGARGVYRGEYALFKTLNVQGVSDKMQSILIGSLKQLRMVRRVVIILSRFTIVIMNIIKFIQGMSRKWVSSCMWMRQKYPG